MRAFNFSAGPAAIPLEVLDIAAQEMTNWHGCGMSVMEMSHRGREFISIYEQSELCALVHKRNHSRRGVP